MSEENVKPEVDADEDSKTMSQDDISSLISELAGNKDEGAETADSDTAEEPREASAGEESLEKEPGGQPEAVAIEITEVDAGVAEDEKADSPKDAADGESETGSDDSDAPKTMSQDDISSLIAELSGKDDEASPEKPSEDTSAVQKEVPPPEKEDGRPPEQAAALEPESDSEEPAAAAEDEPVSEPVQASEKKKKAPAAAEDEPGAEPVKAAGKEAEPPAVAGDETQEDTGPVERPHPTDADTGEAQPHKAEGKAAEKDVKPAHEEAAEPETPPAAAEEQDPNAEPAAKDSGQVKSAEIKAEIDALLETSKPKSKKRGKKSVIAVLSGIFILALAGAAAFYFLYSNPAGGRVSESAPPEEPVEDAVKLIPKKVRTADDGSEKTVFEFEVAEPEQVLGGKLTAAMDLRDQLIEKSTEIEGLKQYYRGGILEMEAEIREKILKNGIKSLEETRRHPDIQYLLKVIQRRQAYVKGLDAPSGWVEHGGEELLYIHRKAEIEIMMKDLVDGINLNEVQAEITDVINTYQMDSDSLGMQPADSDLEPIDAIWKRIYTQSKNKKIANTVTSATQKNRAIWAEICNGNYARKYELTALSPAAAKCLAKSNESDLFLNNISRLSPDAADNLMEWKGNWLCLNGFKTLDAAMAGKLSRWDGNWVSLNGVTDISVDAARKLSEWPGRQIELMGLKYSQGRTRLAALKYLAAWKSNGGKLYVPGKIEQQIDGMMAE